MKQNENQVERLLSIASKLAYWRKDSPEFEQAEYQLSIIRREIESAVPIENQLKSYLKTIKSGLFAQDHTPNTVWKYIENFNGVSATTGMTCAGMMQNAMCNHIIEVIEKMESEA